MTESASVPVVTFPDPAIVESIANAEAPMERPPVVFSWGRAIGWSLLFSLAGSALYGGVVYATDTQFGLVSVVIGLLAGFGAARGGRGRNAQIVGAASAAFGYFAGLFCALAAVVGVKIVNVPIGMLAEAMGILIKETLSGMGLLFLGIAVWEGWRIPAARE